MSCACWGNNVILPVCENQAVGIAQSVKKIPDAHMSGYYADTSSDHKAYEGRLGSGTGWIGSGTSSWLQVSHVTATRFQDEKS